MNLGLRSISSLFLGVFLGGCDSKPSKPGTDSTAGGGGVATASASAKAGQSTNATVTIHAFFDLPRTNLTEGLSGTAFEPATRTLYALQDHRLNIVPLVASPNYRTFTLGTPIPLTGRPEQPWDGEGLARFAGGFIAITHETRGKIERFDMTGKFLDSVPISSRFTDHAIGNLGLESLTISPSGRFLFTANEQALQTDGLLATKSHGTTIRIHQRELATGADRQFAYQTEPVGAGFLPGVMGVSELAAISDQELLVLERGYQPVFGNTVRIFRTDLANGSRVDALSSLTNSPPVLAKTLVIDLATLPPSGATNPSPQPNPILDNYEALAIGPRMADGRRLLFVTSDDNGSTNQVARVLVLAVPGL